MLLTESLVLALLAGLAGSLVVHRAPEVFARVLASPDTPVYQTRPDASTLLYFSAIVFVAACLSGLSPAAEALRVDLVTSIKKGGSDPSRSRTHRSRSLLVAAQVGMTFVLLATAGWFIRARATVLHGDPGFETEHVLLLPINLRPADIATLSRRIREIPGIRNVAFGSPIGQSDLGSNSEEIRLPGQEKGAGRPALLSLVSARYFEVLGMPVLLGRAFTEADEHHTSALCIVSEQFAKAFWPGADPIGRRVLLADGAALEVAGVVRDVASERLGQNDGPHIYRLAGEATQSTPMLIRFSGDERQIGLAVRKALTETDPAAVVPLHSLRFLMNQAADRLARLIWLVCGLAGLAVLLAALGLYGVVDFTMHQRSKELGIRMALGASRTEILKTALLGGAKPVLLGLVAGSTAAMGAGVVVSRVLRHTPVALNPYDFAVYLATAIVLATTALLAMFRPVWRAAVSDPLPALRNE